ncbi:hypothetical protein AKO1_011227, partial [Acrasis kona]
MRLLLGDIKYESAHGDGANQLKRRLQYIGELIDGLLLSDDSEGDAVATRMQVYTCLPIQNTVLKSQQIGEKALKKTAQSKLHKYCAQWNTTHAALYVNHQLFVATDKYLEQSCAELCIMGHYLFLLAPATARDIPVNLRNQAVRLVTVKLDELTELCMICGPTPSPSDVIKAITADALEWEFIHRVRSQVYNQSALLKSIKFDEALYCFLYIDRGSNTSNEFDSENSFFTFEALNQPDYHEEIIPSSNKTLISSPPQSLQSVMVDFFTFTSVRVFESHRPLPFFNQDPTTQPTVNKKVQVDETYMTTRNFAMCAVRRQRKELYCIFDIAIPHCSITGLTKETL